MIIKSRNHGINAVSDFSNSMLNIIFIAYSLLCVLPIVLLISISLSNEASIIADGYRFIPKAVSLRAYQFLLKEPETLIRVYLVTIFVTVTGVILNVIICSMYAFAISRKEFKYKRVFMIVVLITMFFNGGLPTVYFVYVRILHLKDNLLALILAGLCGGFYILIMRSYFRLNLPDEVIESSKIDGASEIRLFFVIVLPVSFPILATIGLFSAVFYWNDFMNSMLYIENSKLYNLQYTMQRAIMNIEFLKSQIGASSASDSIRLTMKDLPAESVRMAMVILGIGPIVLSYPFFQKYFIKGLTIGAVKG